MNKLRILFLTSVSLCFISAAPPLSRNIFLNGKDVSTVRNQTLKNVDVHIDDKGDIVITATHYQVKEQEHYRPLGSPKLETPPHAEPKKGLREDLKSDLKSDLKMESKPETFKTPTDVKSETPEKK